MNDRLLLNLITIAKTIADQRVTNTLRCCHVAFVLDRARILAIGTNSRKTHPLNLRYRYKPEKVGTCAELAVVLKSKEEDFTSLDLVVLRVNRNGLLANSKPCTGCQNLIDKLKFRSVRYSDDYGALVKFK